MSDVKTTAVWPSVSRAITNGPLVEILLVGNGGAAYKTSKAR